MIIACGLSPGWLWDYSCRGRVRWPVSSGPRGQVCFIGLRWVLRKMESTNEVGWDDRAALFCPVTGSVPSKLKHVFLHAWNETWEMCPLQGHSLQHLGDVAAKRCSSNHCIQTSPAWRAQLLPTSPWLPSSPYGCDITADVGTEDLRLPSKNNMTTSLQDGYSKFFCIRSMEGKTFCEVLIFLWWCSFFFFF